MEIALLWAVLVFVVVSATVGVALLLRRAPAPDLSRLDALATSLADTEHRILQSVGTQLSAQRTEISQQLTHILGNVGDSLGKAATSQSEALVTQRAELARSITELATRLSADSTALREASDRAHETSSVNLRQQVVGLKTDVELRLTEFAARIADLSTKIEEKLTALQASNEQRLEQMRQTVDEKLQSTLEARLGASFKLVSERLEAVQQGLGEMKSLADGVGDLKKVMTNVKTRGTWGEVQLQGLIEDILQPGAYEKNFAPREKSGERVEFAIRFPGGQDGKPVYLPIDSKFPVEDYQRLVAAQDAADADGAAVHGKALEDSIKKCAKDIRDKYLEPGVTTDIGILFLPFEGLYAEVLRRPGLHDALHSLKVVIAGPTTLCAMLNSFRMGFSTLAIQQRSGEIRDLLGAVKTEFGKFGEVIDKIGDKLKQAQNEIDKVGVRTRAINRQLKEVETMPEAQAQRLLPVTATGDAPE